MVNPPAQRQVLQGHCYHFSMIRLLTNHEFPGAPDPKIQLQPVGFDLSLKSVAKFVGTGTLDFSNEQRKLPDTQTIEFQHHDSSVVLRPGGYLVTYNEQITVPADCAGIVLPRSSLMRCGAVLHSALWDPGYSGRGQGLLTVYHEIQLHKNARIGQFVLIRLETEAGEMYSGTYQGENL